MEAAPVVEPPTALLVVLPLVATVAVGAVLACSNRRKGWGGEGRQQVRLFENMQSVP